MITGILYALLFLLIGWIFSDQKKDHDHFY